MRDLDTRPFGIALVGRLGQIVICHLDVDQRMMRSVAGRTGPHARKAAGDADGNSEYRYSKGWWTSIAVNKRNGRAVVAGAAGVASFETGTPLCLNCSSAFAGRLL